MQSVGAPKRICFLAHQWHNAGLFVSVFGPWLVFVYRSLPSAVFRRWGWGFKLRLVQLVVEAQFMESC